MSIFDKKMHVTTAELDFKVSIMGIVVQCSWCGDRVPRAAVSSCPVCLTHACDHCTGQHDEERPHLKRDALRRAAAK